MVARIGAPGRKQIVAPPRSEREHRRRHEHARSISDTRELYGRNARERVKKQRGVTKPLRRAQSIHRFPIHRHEIAPAVAVVPVDNDVKAVTLAHHIAMPAGGALPNSSFAAGRVDVNSRPILSDAGPRGKAPYIVQERMEAEKRRDN